VIYLYKGEGARDITNRRAAMDSLESHRVESRIMTGILYFQEGIEDTHEMIKTSQQPLNALQQEDLCPGNAALQQLMEGYR
jgi:2-oxoglutarate/2-oxoacid ferredoxin oxidoreductase subunit beta